MSRFIEAWFTGTREAWNRWQGSLRSALRSFHLAPETEDDIIQDVALQIARKEAAFENRDFGTGQFLNYGKTSVRREALKNRRNPGKTSHLGDGDALVENIPEEEEDDPRLAAIHEWVMDKPQHKHISDCAKDGQSHKQIADSLGISVRTVARRLDEIRIGVEAMLRRGQ